MVDSLLEKHTHNLTLIIRDLSKIMDSKYFRETENYIELYNNYLSIVDDMFEKLDADEKTINDTKAKMNILMEEIKLLLYNKTKE